MKEACCGSQMFSGHQGNTLNTPVCHGQSWDCYSQGSSKDDLSKRVFPSLVFPPKCSNQQRPGQAKARSQELHLLFRLEGSDPRLQSIFCCLCRCISRVQNQKYNVGRTYTGTPVCNFSNVMCASMHCTTTYIF